MARSRRNDWFWTFRTRKGKLYRRDIWKDTLKSQMAEQFSWMKLVNFLCKRKFVFLRVLESENLWKGFFRFRKTNVRIVAATNVNTMKAITDGRFPERILDRLNTVSDWYAPALRERKGDIHLLFQTLRDFAEKYRNAGTQSWRRCSCLSRKLSVPRETFVNFEIWLSKWQLWNRTENNSVN